jgi:uncharacterized surface protein with fasciclin (FAS1) repeats
MHWFHESNPETSNKGFELTVQEMNMKLRLPIILMTAALIFSVQAIAGAHKSAPAKKDIVDTAISAGSFNTLVAAVQAAELVEALKGTGPFTVFAPTDEAFAALPEGTVESLLKPENKEQLQAVLLYHVVSGKIMAADIGSGAQPATLQGATIDVVGSSSGVTVNGANVLSADVMTSNGVIHVIDAVILPPATAAKAN